MPKIIILLLSCLLMTSCSTLTPETIEEIIEEPIEEIIEVEEKVWLSKEALTGLGTDNLSTKAIAVMLGNTVEARPQSGLSQADIVYEIMVEYQVTRLMAIFASQYPEKVGPMRSLRMPFAQKVEELKVGIAHFGGASVGLGDALGYIEKVKLPIRYDGVKGINTAYFSRSSDRKAPHNAYIDLAQAVSKAPEMDLDILRYEDMIRENGDRGEFVSLRYSKGFAPSYRYDQTKEKYQRFYNDLEQIDVNNDEPIMVSNVIIQHVKHRTAEAVGYVLIEFVGTGKAEYFIQGRHIIGTWERTSTKERTIYKDDLGQEVLFQPGNTWIQVVLSSTEIRYE